MINNKELTQIIFELSNQWIPDISNIIYDYLDDLYYIEHSLYLIWLYITKYLDGNKNIGYIGSGLGLVPSGKLNDLDCENFKNLINDESIRFFYYYDPPYSKIWIPYCKLYFKNKHWK